MRPVIAFTIALICWGAAAADQTDTLVCNYQKYATSEGVQSVKKPFVLTFIIDSKNDAAYLVGNNGSSKVQAIPGGGGITFIEITGSGNIMTTTVDSKGVSVHSRHTQIEGEVVPSQYYGVCEFR